ncbi:P27 family phage terminase small subunit [Guyparkeria hydrothermalis]|uniref:P27 family phage terminase small subunit n=1 Tax=Guyparkeria hydrothermalis TaxID=923 RepID=UPI00202001D4|nr:P27 family phage terminase small subunit [Guyparkeria hydrothermalis]MCL7744360.1 P27 family phage terminase small subunit [Guyparkeria hydrothermalis]
MGRHKKPTKLLKLQGRLDPKRAKERAQEPVPAEDLGAAPDHLTNSQKEAWDEISGNAAPGVLTNSDRIAVEIASCLLDELRRSPAEMNASRIARLDSLLGRFGMTPADRSRIKPKEEQATDDPWEQL